MTLTHSENSPNSNNTKFLRQSVRITGYGNETFDKLLANMARVYAIFKRAVGPQLQDEMGVTEEEGYSAIDASNRYFSLRTETNEVDERSITDEMDPKRYLRKAAGVKYIHTEENKVLVYYFEREEDKMGATT